MKTPIFTLLMLSLMATHASATIYYVKPTATGAASGTSWADASGNLAAMISISSAGDEIWVAAGTYKPTTYPSSCTTCGAFGPNNRHNTFMLKSGVKIYGGFAGTESNISQRVAGNESILSGDIGTVGTATDNAYHVVTSVNSDPNTLLERFTIQDGRADGTTSITISGRTYYTSWGGGMVNIFSDVQITNCAIVNNYAYYGGGMLNSSINGFNVAPYLYQCIVVNNTADGEGGGIYNHNFSFTDIEHCTIVNNLAGLGGAIYNFNGSNMTMMYSIVWNNFATSGTPSTTYSIVSNGASPVITRSIVEYDHNTIQRDPLFTNISDLNGPDNKWGTPDDGLVPQNTSPAIDMVAKHVSSFQYGTQDITLQTRYFDVTYRENSQMVAYDIGVYQDIDLGAYECQSNTNNSKRIYVNKDLTTGADNGTSWANAYRGENALQNALNYCNMGDEIWVTAGKYFPVAGLPELVPLISTRFFTYLLPNEIRLYGGFRGTETSFSEKDPNSRTTLSGDFNNNDLIIGAGGTLSISGNSENAFNVVTILKHYKSVRLYGLIIEGGNANNTGWIGKGGGLLCRGDVPAIAIDNCVFRHNVAVEGGAIYTAESTTPDIQTSIQSSVFANNLATNSGGAVKSLGAINAFVNNVFINNRVSGGSGGGLHVNRIGLFIHNNTFYNNSASLHGGGFYINDVSNTLNPTSWYNNIFYKNAIGTNITSTSADFYNGDNANVAIDCRNNSFQFNSASYSTNNTSPNAIGTSPTGNLFAINPRFVSETDFDGPDNNWGTFDDGLALLRTSTLINAGTNSGSLTDILGNGYFGTARDIGAFEWQGKERCIPQRHIADAPIEAGTHYAGVYDGPILLSNARVAGVASSTGVGIITSVGTVQTGTSVTFSASNSITLLPGFQAQNGAVFQTRLQGCPLSISSLSR